MKWGHLDEVHWRVLFRRYEKGLPCKPLDDRPPSIYLWLQHVWKTFWKLHSCRGISFETGYSLPLDLTPHIWQTMLAGGEDDEQFLDYLILLDKEYLAIKAKEVKEKQDDNRDSRSNKARHK